MGTSAGLPASSAGNRPRRIVFVLGLAALTFSIALSLPIPALPALQQAFDSDETDVAWVMTVYFLAAAVLTTVIGRLGDMFGKRRMLLLTLFAFGAGNVLSAIAPSLWVVLLGRVLQGAGGGMIPLSFGLARDVLPANRVSSGIAAIAALSGIGAGLGLVVGGLAVDQLSWQWVFWIGAICAAICIAATAWYVPESSERSPGRVDVVGALLLGAGLTPLLLAISQAHQWGWLGPRTLGLALGGFLILACWVAFERRCPNPLMDVRSLGRRSMLLANIGALILGFEIYAGLPLTLQVAQASSVGIGLTSTSAALMLLPATLSMFAGAGVSTWIGRRFGPPAPLAAGAILSGVGMVLIAVFHESWMVIALLSVLTMGGIAIGFAALANLIVVLVPSTQTGEAMSFNIVVRSIGSALGSQVIASVLAASAVAGVATSGGYQDAYLVGGGVAFLGILVAAMLRRQVPPSYATEATASEPIAVPALPAR